jgi:hypothetical protein
MRSICLGDFVTGNQYSHANAAAFPILTRHGEKMKMLVRNTGWLTPSERMRLIARKPERRVGKRRVRSLLGLTSTHICVVRGARSRAASMCAFSRRSRGSTRRDR